jgi:C4-dicarboxylate transporter DctQ subunit
MSKLIKIEEFITSLLIFVIAVLTVLQVLFRYFLEIPFPWIEELTRYLMIYMIYIGAAIGVYKNDHFKIEILNMILNKNQIRLVNITHQLAIMAFVSVFAYVSLQFVISQNNFGQVAPALQISMSWPMGALVIGSLLMLIASIASIYKNIQIKKEGN